MSRSHDPERRALLRAGLYGAGFGLGMPSLFRDAAWASQAGRQRILVVVELSGGCDGLNTVAQSMVEEPVRAA